MRAFVRNGVKNGLLVAVVLAMGPTPVRAQATEIPWAIVEWPPFTMLKDGKAASKPNQLGEGAVDRMTFEIIKRLSGYRHRFEPANGQRVWAAMERGDNLCYASALKTPERLKFAYFTPAFIGPPMALVVHPSRKDAVLGGANAVSLAKVLEQHGAEGRLQYLRSYGPQLDVVIETSAVPIKRERVPTTGALLKPLATGLFGFTLEYPAAVERAQRTGQLGTRLVTVAIDEAPDWVVAYVACTRNDWGKQVITDIDRAIRKAASVNSYRDAMAKWIPAEFAKDNRPKMRQFHSQRAAGAAQVE